MMRPVPAALCGALALLALAVVLVLLRSPMTVAGTNSVSTGEYAEIESGNVSACQTLGAVPAATSALRISIEARAVAPSVTAKLLSGSRVVSEGKQPAGWGTAPAVTVPIQKLRRTMTGMRVCLSVGPSVEPLRIHGQRASSVPLGANGLQLLTWRVEYLRQAPSSWWSLVSQTAKRMGIGRAPGGLSAVLLALALMLPSGPWWCALAGAASCTPGSAGFQGADVVAAARFLHRW